MIQQGPVSPPHQNTLDSIDQSFQTAQLYAEEAEQRFAQALRQAKLVEAKKHRTPAIKSSVKDVKQGLVQKAIIEVVSRSFIHFYFITITITTVVIIFTIVFIFITSVEVIIILIISVILIIRIMMFHIFVNGITALLFLLFRMGLPFE